MIVKTLMKINTVNSLVRFRIKSFHMSSIIKNKGRYIMLHYIMKMKTFIMGNLFLGLRDAYHIRHPIYKKIFLSSAELFLRFS